jgi:CRP/FNR family transcriptional regulator
MYQGNPTAVNTDQISRFIPVWDQLKKNEQELLTSSSIRQTVREGAILHEGIGECEGLFCVLSGQLRAYVLSPEGKEITIYRLLEGDMCLFSASCMFSGAALDISVAVEKGGSLLTIPSAVYKKIMNESSVLSNFTNQLMAERFSDVMWLLEQILWKSLDRRLAAFLLEESRIDHSDSLTITHEKIADHLGTAREVITRMLKYLQSENLIQLSRGRIDIKDEAGLEKLAG